jgi:predicted ester cyclase
MTSAPDTAAVAANRALGRRFFEEQDRLRGGPAETLCAPDYRAMLGGNPPVDRAGHEAFAQAFYRAFDGIGHTIEDVIATDDRVVVRFILKGRHTGDFFGIPPTGRSIVVAAHAILHLAGGQVTRLFGIFDEAGLLRQLGVLPSNTAP